MLTKEPKLTFTKIYDPKDRQMYIEKSAYTAVFQNFFRVKLDRKNFNQANKTQKSYILASFCSFVSKTGGPST